MKHLLITGSPGIGKTTLVKKLLEALKLKEIDYDGFYTEEIRNNNYRVGFDIVTLDGNRAVLARKSSTNTANMPMVGQYAVHLDEFEKLALPIFEKPKRLMIVDEIGKMEMFSKRFQENIKNVFENKDVTVIATVPLKGGPCLVKQLKDRKDCDLLTVTQANRDDLLSDILKSLKLNCKE